MTEACIKGSPITITCDGYRNPIYQDQWYGYSVEFYDAEANPKLTEKSISTFLDATAYEPFKMAPNALSLNPQDNTINKESQWYISLQPGLPMNEECYIKILLPTDLEYQFNYVEPSGIFLDQGLSQTLTTDDVIIVPKTATEPRIGVKFKGCYDQSSIGLSPSGGAWIDSITTQKAKMPSGEFGLEIWKDEEETQAIAILTKGVIVPADQVQTDFLRDVKIYPLVETVQVASLLFVEFTTSSNLYKGARVEITLPAGLKKLEDGKNEVTGYMGSTRATSYEYKDGKVIIDNLVTSDKTVAPFTFKFGLDSIENQISSKDAGSFLIETFYLSPHDTNFYVVDRKTEATSFTATTGLLTAEQDITIDNPTNYQDDAVYSFIFSEDSMVPLGGYLKIDFPEDVVFTEEVALKTEVCATTECELDTLNKKSILIKTTEEVAKKDSVTVKIGGIKNARSFQPSGSFKITSIDTDKKSLIDIGFNKNVATSKAGEIKMQAVKRDNEINGAINTYEFSITSSVPWENGDVLKFSFPKEVQVNAD